MDHPDIVDLAQIPLFKTLTAAQLSDLATHLEVEEFRAGQVLTHEGASGYAFYILRTGSAEVTIGGRVVGKLDHNDFFGEMVFFNNDGHRNATVTALEDGVAWSMFGTAFRVLEREFPEIGSAIRDAAEARKLADR